MPTRGESVSSVEEILEWLDAHRYDFPWASGRGLDQLRPGAEFAVARHRIRNAFDDPTHMVVQVGHNGDLRGVTTVAPKPMETELLGIDTVEITDLLVPSGTTDRTEDIGRLVHTARHQAHDNGAELVIIRIDTTDHVAALAAQQAGFTVHETAIAWLRDASVRSSRNPPSQIITRRHAEPIDAVITSSDAERLRAATGAWRMSHLAADPRIPADRVEAYYRTWIDNIVDGTWSDVTTTAWIGSELVGLVSMTLDTDVHVASGAEIAEVGWMVALRHEERVGAALSGSITSPGALDHNQLWVTQADNPRVINLMMQFGRSRITRTSYTMHSWAP